MALTFGAVPGIMAVEHPRGARDGRDAHREGLHALPRRRPAAHPPRRPARYLGQVPGWELLDDARLIRRTFRFKNFREAFAFVHAVGELAEAEGHHPDVCFGWGYATVALRTKKINGLHENDFIMAAKVDARAGGRGGATGTGPPAATAP